MRWVLLVLAAALAFATAPALAAEKLDAASDYGLIAMEVEPAGPLAIRNGGYGLGIGRFSPDEHVLADWGYKGGYGRETERRYYLRKVKPGAYAFHSLWVKRWVVCFNANTATFDVKAGQVTFIGRFDPRPTIDGLMDGIRARQIPSTSRGEINFQLDVTNFTLTPPEQLGDWKPGLAGWLAAHEPGVKGEIVGAQVTATHFNTGKNLFGTSRSCGGYSVKADKPLT